MKKELERIQKQIQGLDNLIPGKTVNNAFSNLVKLATSFKKKEIELKKYFQIVSAKAEIEMEKYWAKKIIDSENSMKTMQTFWYYKNYVDLTKLEFGALSLCHDHKIHKKILFVGSGPLPLTGIILARDFNCQVTFLDNDKNSLEMSKVLCKKLKLNNVNFVLADAIGFTDYDKYDTIFIAAMLASKTITKEKFISLLAKKIEQHTHVLVRSAFHNRELLYKKLDIMKVKGLKPILEVRPKNEIVNSFHVFEK